MKIKFSIPLTLVVFLFATPAVNAQTSVVSFESLPVPGSGFFNGDTAGGSPYRNNFTITGTGAFGETLQTWEMDSLDFFNSFESTFGSWNGFSWSNISDNTTPGFTNQYAAYPGGGSDGAGGMNLNENYAVAFSDASYFNLPENTSLQSVDLTNTTYAALSMANGDSFGKTFGGESGNEEDFFKINLVGYDQVDRGGNQTGSVEFFLADFRFSDNSLDYILNQWATVDLTSLGSVRSVGVTFASSDVGAFGINTPTYFAMDNLTFTTTAVPEPSGLLFLWTGLITIYFRRSKKILA